MASMGSVVDKSGEAGVNAELVENFYTACADYASWREKAETDADAVLPYGGNTADAYAASLIIKDKVEDYFTRCKLIAYDPAAASAVAVDSL